MKGKEKCRILKEIRQRIADENGIEYITSECQHKGDCRGTCPKCESEVRYLERELDKKYRLGKRIAVIGVAAGIALTGIGCTDDVIELEGDVPYVDGTTTETTDGILPAPDEEEILMGEPEAPPYVDETEEENPDEEEILMGEPEAPPYVDETEEENPDEEEILMGEVPATFFPESPEGYEGCTVEFINESMTGMNISDVMAAWGDPDMNQASGDRAIIAYFLETGDIVLQYTVGTGDIINATVIPNE